VDAARGVRALQVCSSGHLTWNPPLVYGNFSVKAQWFNANTGKSVETSTGFIGLDSNNNMASITMGFHGAGWLGGNGLGTHRYQHGIYSNVTMTHNREYTNTTVDITAGLHEYGLLWSKDKVEWSFDGRVVRTVTDASIIPFQQMQLRLHTRSG
jgi:beta-glucanase (GH16 family)